MAEYKYSSTIGLNRCISSINKTAFGSRFVNKPAKSPGLSKTGPDVNFNETPSSLAIMFERVVFPSPGGPCSRTWSRASPRILAALTKILRFSTILLWPLKSSNSNGRNCLSISFSFSESDSSLKSKCSFMFSYYSSQK